MIFSKAVVISAAVHKFTSWSSLWLQQKFGLHCVWKHYLAFVCLGIL